MPHWAPYCKHAAQANRKATIHRFLRPAFASLRPLAPGSDPAKRFDGRFILDSAGKTLAFVGGTAAVIRDRHGYLETKLTEIGTLEIWCISRDGKDRWKLEFDVRQSAM